VIAVGFVIALAPAPLAKWWGESGANEMALLEDHSAASLSLGGRFAEGETWANGVSLEMMRRPVRAEVQMEDFWRPRHVRYITARGGYVWHPRRAAAGGVTIGYVHSDGDAAQSGPELGLPLFIGSRDMTMRIEPTYVFSAEGPLWTYRLQMEGYFPRREYFAGFAMVLRSYPLRSNAGDEFAAQAVTALFGKRF
jgi:hypothetical protein